MIMLPGSVVQWTPQECAKPVMLVTLQYSYVRRLYVTVAYPCVRVYVTASCRLYKCINIYIHQLFVMIVTQWGKITSFRTCPSHCPVVPRAGDNSEVRGQIKR